MQRTGLHRAAPPGAGAAVLALVVALACGGDTGTGPSVGEDPDAFLVAGVARADLSPEERLGGFLVFFLERDGSRLLAARAAVNGDDVGGSFEPQTVPGPVYFSAEPVDPGGSYRLTATVTTPDGPRTITSTAVRAPADFEIQVPAEHPAGTPLAVAWEPLPDAERVTVTVGSGFEVDVAASDGAVTVPTAAFAGLAEGTGIEVEVTAYNGLFVSIATGVSAFADVDAFASRLSAVDNVDGAVGAFGAATTRGALVTVR